LAGYELGVASKTRSRERLSNKGMKQTNLSAAPGQHGSAASCARGKTDGRTGSQLIPGVLRTVVERKGVAVVRNR
jgi:hypothetical protein